MNLRICLATRRRLRRNSQIPTTNHQMMTENPMTKILRIQIGKYRLGHLDIGHWNLFGAWDLVG